MTVCLDSFDVALLTQAVRILIDRSDDEVEPRLLVALNRAETAIADADTPPAEEGFL
jgi:hypothetical protein